MCIYIHMCLYMYVQIHMFTHVRKCTHFDKYFLINIHTNKRIQDAEEVEDKVENSTLMRQKRRRR
jgi:hypothetical protein